MIFSTSQANHKNQDEFENAPHKERYPSFNLGYFRGKIKGYLKRTNVTVSLSTYAERYKLKANFFSS